MSWFDKVKSLPNNIADGSCEFVKVYAAQIAMVLAMVVPSNANAQRQQDSRYTLKFNPDGTYYFEKNSQQNRVSAQQGQNMTYDEKQRLEDERTAANKAISLKSAQDRIENAKRQAINESQYAAQRTVTGPLEDLRTIKNNTYSTISTVEMVVRAFGSIGRR